MLRSTSRSMKLKRVLAAIDSWRHYVGENASDNYAKARNSLSD